MMKRYLKIEEVTAKALMVSLSSLEYPGMITVHITFMKCTMRTRGEIHSISLLNKLPELLCSTSFINRLKLINFETEFENSPKASDDESLQVKKYSTRKATGHLNQIRERKENDIDIILKSSTYTNIESSENTRLSLYLKRKSQLEVHPIKMLKISKQSSIYHFFPK
jgi:hypothetical protein